MRSATAAVAAAQAVYVWNPRFLLLTGITGGVKKTTRGSLGDVIIAEQIVGYEHGKISDASTERREVEYRLRRSRERGGDGPRD
jgi:nucleoside phosphorylase